MRNELSSDKFQMANLTTDAAVLRMKIFFELKCSLKSRFLKPVSTKPIIHIFLTDIQLDKYNVSF